MHALKHASLTRADERGRPSLHRISPFALVDVMAMAGVKVRLVPREFWNKDVADDGDEPLALIACPCGHTPEVPELEIVSCECQRAYFNGITEVWSLNVPTSRTDDSSPDMPDSGVDYGRGDEDDEGGDRPSDEEGDDRPTGEEVPDPLKANGGGDSPEARDPDR